ncbi:MAG: hypothetical protein CVU38_09285 [Chloroflexi bacterium HGW-Chloroflexi-1]|nr:MAG: hypothetical protein CVU38_09285 [Chloroflexi bacterium HGW-Chloroflexi-1]
MRENTLTTLVKSFVIIVAAAILALAAFGIGLSVGAHSQAAFPTDAPPTLSLPNQTAAPATPTPDHPATDAPGVSGGEDTLDMALFQEVLGLLEEQFYGDLPQGQELTYEVLRGFVSQLGDPHTAFMDPRHAALFSSDLEGHFEGIGARVDLAEGGGVRLTYLFPKQPAEEAGLQVDDVIVAVDGQDVTKLSLLEVISLIRGPDGSTVVLTIHRGVPADAGMAFDVSVVRARIEIPVVESKTLADGRVAYIALSEFSNVAPARLAEALQAALATKPEGLILDLRGNPGGLLDASVQIGSYFVPEGNILLERFQDGKEQVYARQGRYLLGNTPLVVLVDGGSASAAEIVAGAIQDADTGILIGAQTYGKGSVQLPNTLSDGSQLRVTIAHWFTPQGRGIHGEGLEPDIAVPFTKEDAAAGRDPQLDRAVKYLSEKLAG